MKFNSRQPKLSLKRWAFCGGVVGAIVRVFSIYDQPIEVPLSFLWGSIFGSVIGGAFWAAVIVWFINRGRD